MASAEKDFYCSQSLSKSPDTHWQLHTVTAVFYFPHYSYTCDAHHKTHHGRHHPKNLVSLAVIHDRISREYRDQPKLGKGHTLGHRRSSLGHGLGSLPRLQTYCRDFHCLGNHSFEDPNLTWLWLSLTGRSSACFL